MSVGRQRPQGFEWFLRQVFCSPWLWGIGLTVGFYMLLPSLPIDQTLAYRYFESHWIEHTTVGMFFVGVSVLFGKAVQLPADLRALRGSRLAILEASPDRRPEVLSQRLEGLFTQDPNFAATAFGQRVMAAAEYMRRRQTTDGIDEHLSYLADTMSSRLHDGYALIRTVTWAIPILGFLGTVIGITIAIANVTPDQLESSLSEVTGGLAVAFDTTALSLALSMGLVFATYIIERQEQLVLDRVEDAAVSELLPRLLSPAGPTSLVAAESEAAAQLLAATGGLIDHHCRAWEQALSQQQSTWIASFARQHEALDHAVKSSLERAVGQYVEQLSVVPREFAQAFEAASRAITLQVAATEATLQRQHLEWTQATASVWSAFTNELDDRQQAQLIKLDELSSRLESAIGQWTSQIAQTSDQLQEPSEALREVSIRLAQLGGREGELARIEQELNANLNSLRVAETLDQTLLNLNAAVNLLSARASRELGKAA